MLAVRGQKGIIIPLVLFGSLAVVSGIALIIYFQIFRANSDKVVSASPSPVLIATSSPKPQISDFESCSKAGNPVAESYPRTCRAEGKIFTEVVSIEATQSGNIADWEVYRDSKYNYELKYPISLKVANVAENAPDFFKLDIAEGEYIRVEAHELSPFNLESETAADLKRMSATKTNFQGRPAVAFRPARNIYAGEPFKGLVVYFEERKMKIIFGYYGLGSNETLFDQILENVKL